MSVGLRMLTLLTLLMKRTERASRAWCSSCSSCLWSEQNEHREQRLLTRIFYVYITKIVFLNRSFVLNSCNNQYTLFYCLSYLQTLVYSSRKFVTLVYLYLYLVLLIKQSLHFEHSFIHKILEIFIRLCLHNQNELHSRNKTSSSAIQIRSEFSH